ncbi:MAG: hypothetical protein GF355_09650 [Candidatus Eisenbacteria bacterium]|nr:hypothetical protein [Candidatus Eisenbacteria bacterium]
MDPRFRRQMVEKLYRTGDVALARAGFVLDLLNDSVLRGMTDPQKLNAAKGMMGLVGESMRALGNILSGGQGGGLDVGDDERRLLNRLIWKVRDEARQAKGDVEKVEEEEDGRDGDS